MLLATLLLSATLAVQAINENTEFEFFDDKERCTTIGVGAKGTIDGSTITTHNNDCQECDIRITHVPAKDWPPGSKRPISDIRDAYPRYIESPDDNIHGPDYLRSPSYPDSSIYAAWNNTVAFAYIDQVPHTYAYTLGTYAIQNEKQVSIGESTCSAKFIGKPAFAPGGKALLHMETLTELALERCDSARCAVQLMGDLSVKHGFYGPEWEHPGKNAQDEAGEALIVSDPYETWVFHVLPDDTGGSAIWVAQRVPDDHITVVANQFTIGEIDITDTHNFLASENIFNIAIRTHLWDPLGGNPFHFSRIYGNDRYKTSYACTRRMWRVFTLAAPSIKSILSPFTDGLATFGYGPDFSLPYPFSVKVDKPLSVQDIMNMNRDQFEGTIFDLTIGIDAGPFGDPLRFAPLSKWEDSYQGVGFSDYNNGLGFERPISLWRTAYSTVTQSRSYLPDNLGAVTWIAQYAPHHSTFVPVYASADKTPSSLNTGTQYKVDQKSNWWIHCMTGNYLSRWYKYSIEDVKTFQQSMESKIFKLQIDMERTAIAMTNNIEELSVFLKNWHEDIAVMVRDSWWDFFIQMAGVYRDLYKVTNIHTENFNYAYTYAGVPRWWYESIGFWGQPGNHAPGEKEATPIYKYTYPSEKSMNDYKRKYPNGFMNISFTYSNNYQYTPLFATSPDSSTYYYSSAATTLWLYEMMISLYYNFLYIVFGGILGVIGTIVYYRYTRKSGYEYMPL